MTKEIGTIVRLESGVKFKTRTFTVCEDSFALPDGKVISRNVVHHPGAVVILPFLPDRRIILVRQHRLPVGQYLLEAPAGTLEAGEAPLACAQRELAEEAGQRAEEWFDLGPIFSAPGFCDEKLHLFACRNLSPFRLQCDEDEDIEIVSLTFEEVQRAAESGEICDAKTLAILYRAQLRGDFR